MPRSDPALDLAKLFGSLAAITQGKTGSRVLSEFFEVSEWSTEFFQLAFAVSERIDNLEALIRADAEIDEELQNEYSAHLHSLRQALTINAFSNDWNWAVQRALTPDRIAFLRAISPTVRRYAGY